MSLEALWTVEFEVPGGSGSNAAVVVLKGGRIYGGDSGYYYVGTYTVAGDTVSGEVQATNYHGPAITAFGDPASTFAAQLSGKLNSNGDQITGTVTRSRLGQVQMRMTKRAPLV